jgi:diaminopimelate epimerase
VEVPFLKMHGLGNDYVYLDLVAHPELAAIDFSSFSQAVSDRHLGVGSDGVILIEPGEATSELGMRIFNADGSEGEMCGNGVRCLMRYGHARGYAPRVLAVHTRAGRIRGEVLGDGQVRVDMGRPRFERSEIGFLGQGVLRDVPVETGGERLVATGISMGNPHLVCFPEEERDLKELALGIGPELERVAFAPQRTNVEFARVLSRDRVAMEVWERGSGRTQACGTGACATLVAAAWTGRCGRSADVELAGGVLHIDWERDDHVFMTGPAAFSFEGMLLWPPRKDAETW